MSEVLEFLKTKLTVARRELASLVQNYQQLNDDERLAKSNLIFDHLNSYIQIEGNFLFPLLEKAEGQQRVIEQTRDLHERIKDIAEKAIMLHVDEPGFEYYDEMNRLLGLVDALTQNDNESIFLWAEQNLCEQDSVAMMKRLRDQTVQESSMPVVR
jgi:hypothetical protein